MVLWGLRVVFLLGLLGWVLGGLVCLCGLCVAGAWLGLLLIGWRRGIAWTLSMLWPFVGRLRRPAGTPGLVLWLFAARVIGSSPRGSTLVV